MSNDDQAHAPDETTGDSGKRMGKDLPATVPERARQPILPKGDATVVISMPSASVLGAHTSIDTVPPMTIDSYQPQALGSGGSTAFMSAPPQLASQREVIVPSSATVASIIEQVHKRPAERLEVESRLASGGMAAID